MKANGIFNVRLAWVLVCASPLCANADTIYLCKAYSGGMFWSSSPCGPRKATLDRMVTVPDDMSWDQKVAMGEASWAQARALTAPPSSHATQQQQQAQQPSKQSECASLKDSIANLDAQMRAPQSGQMQDILKQQRQQLSDRRYRLQC